MVINQGDVFWVDLSEPSGSEPGYRHPHVVVQNNVFNRRSTQNPDDYGEPPHIHAQRENKVAKFWLDPVALQKAGGFRSTELNKIAKLVQENRDYLMEQWNEFFGY